MQAALFALAGLIAIFIFFQDVKDRKISIYLLLLHTTVYLLLSYTFYSFLEITLNVLFSAFFLLFSLLLFKTYLLMRKNKALRIIDNYFGKADVWTLLVLGLMLPPQVFLKVFLAVCVIGLLWHLGSNRKHVGVPLAGIMVIVQALYILMQKYSLI